MDGHDVRQGKELGRDAEIHMEGTVPSHTASLLDMENVLIVWASLQRLSSRYTRQS